MANIYKNEKTSLTTTDLTTLYTVPSNSRAIVKSLLVAEDNQRQINRALTSVVEQLNSTFLRQQKEDQERFTWLGLG